MWKAAELTPLPGKGVRAAQVCANSHGGAHLISTEGLFKRWKKRRFPPERHPTDGDGRVEGRGTLAQEGGKGRQGCHNPYGKNDSRGKKKCESVVRGEMIRSGYEGSEHS